MRFSVVGKLGVGKSVIGADDDEWMGRLADELLAEICDTIDDPRWEHGFRRLAAAVWGGPRVKESDE